MLGVSPGQACGAGSVAALLAVAIATPAVAAERIVVLVDEARILKLPDRATTVVIGNPLIADVSVQTGGVAVVTGKGYGMTNIVAMDHSGAVLMERNVQVQGPRGNVVFVYKGVDRETYSCTPKCEPRPHAGRCTGLLQSDAHGDRHPQRGRHGKRHRRSARAALIASLAASLASGSHAATIVSKPTTASPLL